MKIKIDIFASRARVRGAVDARGSSADVADADAGWRWPAMGEAGDWAAMLDAEMLDTLLAAEGAQMSKPSRAADLAGSGADASSTRNSHRQDDERGEATAGRRAGAREADGREHPQHAAKRARPATFVQMNFFRKPAVNSANAANNAQQTTSNAARSTNKEAGAGGAAEPELASQEGSTNKGPARRLESPPASATILPIVLVVDF